jgi:quinol monooxygenase YgiN
MGNSDGKVSIVVHFTAKPGKDVDLLQSMKDLLEPTRKERVCIRYELNQEVENKAAFTFCGEIRKPCGI